MPQVLPMPFCRGSRTSDTPRRFAPPLLIEGNQAPTTKVPSMKRGARQGGVCWGLFSIIRIIPNLNSWPQHLNPSGPTLVHPFPASPAQSALFLLVLPLLSPHFSLWLDHNHPAYWAGTGLATAVFVGWVLSALWTERRASPGPDLAESGWRSALVLLLLLAAWRWPLWFYPGGYNPDESQLVAGALTLAHDPVFWRSVDGFTGGPLDFGVLLWVRLLTLPVNFLTARLTGLLLVWGALVFTYRLLRLYQPRAPARLALLPAAVFFAIVTQDDFIHYSTEHLPIFVLACACYLLVRKEPDTTGHRASWWAGGAVIGLLPWTKLQAVPFVPALLLWAAATLWWHPGLEAARRWRFSRELLLAALVPNLVGLGLVAATGVWPVFLRSYLLQNVTYVSSGMTMVQVWHIMAESLNSTWHFQACFVLPGLVALAGSLAGRPLGLWRRGLWWLGLILFAAAAMAVLTPRRPAAHYLLFLVIPLTCWSGAVLGAIWQKRDRRWFRLSFAAIWLLLAGVGPLALRWHQPIPEMVNHLAEFQARPLTAVGRITQAFARPDDSLAVWGWMCDFYVETGLRQGARQAVTHLCIQPSPRLDAYRAEFLDDVRHNRPAVFVDAVGPTADFFRNRNQEGHETFPALAAFVRENYVEVMDLEYARVYVRADRYAANRHDAAHLLALAETGRPVRGKPGPEPLGLDHAGLPGNVIDGRPVRMMLPRAEISWPLRGTEREFHFECGYDPRAYLEGDGNGTLFTAELATPSGAVYQVYSRLLDPVHQASDRGLVRDHFPLPPVPAGARLILRTSPGPEENSVWDWAYLASAAFVHSPLYAPGQFPGFNRLPDTVTSDVAYVTVEGDQPVLALHAPASLAFQLHGGERSLAFDFGFRAGAYRNGGNTDGAGYRVALRRAGQPDAILLQRVLQPVNQPADQGNQHADLLLPGDIEAGAELVLTIDPGPHGSPAWDWTCVANLQVR